MSDVMLHGVLEMPPELWSGDRLDVIQRHSRYLQASQRIRQDAETIRALSERLDKCFEDADIALETARKEERERCAKVCEERAKRDSENAFNLKPGMTRFGAENCAWTASALAAAIRAGK